MEVPSVIVIAIIVLVILLIIIVYRFLGGSMPSLINQDVNKGQGSTTQYSPFASWGASSPVDDSPCISYKFKPETGTINGNRWVSLGSPSLMQISVTGGDPNGCGNCYTVGTKVDCIDDDIINASPYIHTCNKTVLPGTGVSYETYTDKSQCTTISGEKVNFGETETFYNYCPSGFPTFCRGEIGNATIGYKSVPSNEIPTAPITDPENMPVGNQFLCMYASSTGDDLTMKNCNLSETEQQFRVSRNDPGKTFSTYTYGQNVKDTGLTGQNIAFYHRDSGLFLYPEKSPDPANPNEKIKLILKEPDAVTKGYVWAVIPQTKFSESVNCQSFYGNKIFDENGHPVKIDDDGKEIEYSNKKDSDYSKGRFKYENNGNGMSTQECINFSSKYSVSSCQDDCYSTCTFNVDTCLKKYCSVDDPTGISPDSDGINYEILTCGIKDCDISSNITENCKICEGGTFDSDTGNCTAFKQNEKDKCRRGCEDDGANTIYACYQECSDNSESGFFNSPQRKPSPAQIIYIGDVFTKTLPTNADDLYNFITYNNCKAIRLDTDNTLILQPFQTTLSVINYAKNTGTISEPMYETNTDYAKDCHIKSGTYCFGYTNPCDKLDQTIKNCKDNCKDNCNNKSCKKDCDSQCEKNTYPDCMSYVQYENGLQYSMPINYILFNTMSSGVPGG